MLDYVPTAQEVRRLTSSLAFIKLDDKLNSAMLGCFRTNVAWVEAQPTILPLFTEQSKEVPFSATNFHDGFASQVISVHQIVRNLRAGGRTVILVSHFLLEVLELADTISVLRDGRVVRTGPAADETDTSLVAAMLGRPASRTPR